MEHDQAPTLGRGRDHQVHCSSGSMLPGFGELLPGLLGLFEDPVGHGDPGAGSVDGAPEILR
ncbi:hypothetical protein [Streptomyces halobius]|uniref:Uncharacterized protein n=1 Tax=Streptomyces halobius TaxID=2879846 RepID=A0ABY4M5Q5_9ACTN|nr:hypothetical protein [Streptomyces halobius]UQA92797.1 hypothetical protein K9S39_14015 [Streptomyces halobius]